jgi:hypothetical protein
MGHGTDEQRALAHESRRVRSALDDLAGLAGEKRRRAATPIPGLTPESFPIPPQASLPPAPAFGAVDWDAPPEAVAPAPAPGENDWFGDDDALAFNGSASSGEVDFNSAPDGPQDTLGMRAASTLEMPAVLAEPTAPAAPTPEAINDVLDGFEW